MCLILIALKSHPAYKLIIAGNRDEFFERPTLQAAFWEDAPDLLSGKDLRAGGTWFGITKQGRIAGITDYRDPALIKNNAPSRGELVRDFLQSHERPVAFINGIVKKRHVYNGFNLIIGDKDELHWYSNIVDEHRRLEPGIYGLCNHLLDTPWPKVNRGKNSFQKLLSEKRYPSPEDFFSILSDRLIADDKSLPETGVEVEWERKLSSIFVSTPTYGTRSTTLLLVDPNDGVIFMERTFDAESNHSTRKYEFQIEE